MPTRGGDIRHGYKPCLQGRGVPTRGGGCLLSNESDIDIRLQIEYNIDMPYYDEIVKHLMDRFPHAFAALALNTTDVEVGEKLSTEQPTIKVHHSDMTFKIRLPDEEAILHIEAQTDDSREKPMPLRMLAYASFLVLEHEMPVYSTVLYFRPPAGRNDPGFYRYGNTQRGRLWFEYTVVRLYELEGEPFLDASSIGLLPFTPLMKPPAGMGAEVWVETCIERTRAAAVDKQTRGMLLFALSLFGSLVHNPELFQDQILEGIMRESPFYDLVIQRGVQQGVERGARETTIENTLTVLTARFPNADITELRPTLEAVRDLDRLKQLILKASLAPSFREFRRELEGS